MGAFVTNLHVRDTDTGRVARALLAELSAPAYMQAHSASPWTGVYPSDMDQQLLALPDLARRLSDRLSTPVIGSNIHDSDVYEFVLMDRGRLVDSYDSWPGYFDGQAPKPRGGDPVRLLPFCLPGVTAEALESALRPDVEEDEDGPYAQEIATEFAALLGLPPSAAHASFRLIDRGEDYGAMIWLDGSPA